MSIFLTHLTVFFADPHLAWNSWSVSLVGRGSSIHRLCRLRSTTSRKWRNGANHCLDVRGPKRSRGLKSAKGSSARIGSELWSWHFVLFLSLIDHWIDRSAWIAWISKCWQRPWPEKWGGSLRCLPNPSNLSKMPFLRESKIKWKERWWILRRKVSAWLWRRISVHNVGVCLL